MFLPVLLVRDYGLWGFVVFAVPNVVGAAAMGWVLRKESSERLLAANLVAIRCFSTVTVAFNVYFLIWIFRTIPKDVSAFWGPLLLVGGVSCCAFIHPGRVRPIAAAVVLCISVLCATVLLNRWHMALPFSEEYDRWLPPRPELVPLGAVCLLGFSLCPYLDGSFHLARQRALGRSATGAFALGFGVFFLAMILFTLVYAPLFVLRNDGLSLQGGSEVRSWVGLHLTLQVFATCGIHAGFVFAFGPRPARSLSLKGLGRAGAWAAVTLALPFAAVLFQALAEKRHSGLAYGEIIYRGLMAFYGLVFPAYVWICMIPMRDGHSGIGGTVGRWKFRVWAFAVGVAAPMFWMGFIERQEWWLAPGLAVVLAARAVIPGGLGFGRLPPRPSDGPTPAPTGPTRAR